MAFLGDLEERYQMLRQDGHPLRARYWYFCQIVTSIWPFLYAALSGRSEGPSVFGLSTGFVLLDEMTGGLRGGELIVLASRPSIGTTAFALNIAQHVAMHPSIRKPVAVFSFDMSSSAVMTRLLLAGARVNQHRFRAGYLDADERRKLQVELADLAGAPLFVDDTGGLTLAQIRDKLQGMKREHGLSLVVIDDLHMINDVGWDCLPQGEATSISRGLKRMARELNVPFVVLSKIYNPSVAYPTDPTPSVRDLDSLGPIRRDADLVAFIHRDEVYRKHREDLIGVADVIVVKHRNGPVGTIPLRFVSAYNRFENRSEDLV
jgi:replicative DNA helicase